MNTKDMSIKTLVYADSKTQKGFVKIRPEIGQTVYFRGMYCVVIGVREMGTIDIESAEGRCFRLSGLGF